MSKTKADLPPLEQGILLSMRAIDNQIARAMERTPVERESRGVQKWEPIGVRVEQVSGFVLNAFAENQLRLDSVLVMAQGMTKVLSLIVDELGEEGLGEIRTAYSVSAMESIVKDMERSLRGLKNSSNLM